jgi:hypothetical protein
MEQEDETEEIEQERWNKRGGTGEMEQERWNWRDGRIFSRIFFVKVKSFTRVQKGIILWS